MSDSETAVAIKIPCSIILQSEICKPITDH